MFTSRLQAISFAATTWVALGIGAAQLGAETLAVRQFPISGSTGDESGIRPEVTVTFQFHNPDYTQSAFLFNDVRFSESDVGVTVMSDATIDGDFPLAAAILTNGFNDPMSVYTFQFSNDGQAGGSEAQTTEAAAFFDDPAGSSHTDFVGASIMSMRLRMDSLTLSPTTVGGQPGQTASGAVTLFVEGTIPEPSLAACWLLPAVCIGLARHRRRPRRDLGALDGAKLSLAPSLC